MIDLEPASHRDPSGAIPALADAVRRRDFHHEAVGAAIDDGRVLSQAVPRRDQREVPLDGCDRQRVGGGIRTRREASCHVREHPVEKRCPWTSSGDGGPLSTSRATKWLAGPHLSEPSLGHPHRDVVGKGAWRGAHPLFEHRSQRRGQGWIRERPFNPLAAQAAQEAWPRQRLFLHDRSMAGGCDTSSIMRPRGVSP